MSQINLLDLLIAAKGLTSGSGNLEYNRAICELLADAFRRDAALRDTVLLVASLLNIDSGVQ